MRQLLVPFIIWTFLALIIDGNFTVDIIKERFLYPDKGFWFLWVLFIINVVFVLGNRISNMLNLELEIVLLSLCLLFIATMVLFEIRIMGFQFIAYYFIFYSIGYFLHKFTDIFFCVKAFVLILLLLLWSFLAWFWQMNAVPVFLKDIPLPATIIQYSYRFITAIVAICFLFAVSHRILSVAAKWNSFFINMGTISLGIYTFHIIALGLIVNFYKSFLLSDSFVIGLSFFSCVLLSWVVVNLLYRWRVTAKWLLGKI